MHLNKIKNFICLICPLELPYNAEIFAHTYAAAPSPYSFPQQASVNRAEEKYFVFFASI